MIKILANDGISKSAIDYLQQNGFYISTTHHQDDLINVINKEEYKVLLVRSATKVRKELIDSCPKLEIIGRGGVGTDNIDVEYAKEKGINAFNTPVASSLSVAELVFTLIWIS